MEELELSNLHYKIDELFNEKLERQLVKAFHRDWDGLDVYINGSGKTEYRPWVEGYEPQYPSWDAPLRRYSFDGVTYQDIKRAHEL